MGDAEQTLEHRQEAADRLRIERLADPRWPCPSPVTGGVGLALAELNFVLLVMRRLISSQ